MRERLYTFTLSDGSVQVLTLQDALKIQDDQSVKKRIDQIVENSRNKRMKKDGFTPGWQENIQAYCGGRREYDRALKERGLVELGYDYVPQESTRDDLSPCANEEFVQAAIEAGVDISGNEAEAIKSGEYFKD